MRDLLLHSLVFAQIVGLYFIIMAIILIARRNFYRPLLTDLRANSGALLVGASFSLIMGLLLITTHNLWAWHVHVLVTVIGWIIVIKSILWLAIPERMIQWSQWAYSGAGYYIGAVVMGLIGIYLLTAGFYFFL